jgi:carbonic anhydrase
MKRVDIVYRCVEGASEAHERPHNAGEALQRLNQGSLTFASLFATLASQERDVRHEIHVDPRDFGLLESADGSLRQVPFAAVLGCSDARVPVELIFNEGPNDLFVVRVAGNTLGDDVLGSLKFAVERLRASLKLIVVLGHSGCGAVTAAVDVFLDPAGYFALTSRHSVRMLVDRLQVVVHAAALRIDSECGADIRCHPRYRELLIETSVVTNAALAAHTLRQAIMLTDGGDIRAAYGVYVLSDRSVWAPRTGSDEVLGLAAPPEDPQGFVEFGRAVLRSKRMTDLLSV